MWFSIKKRTHKEMQLQMQEKTGIPSRFKNKFKNEFP